MPAVSSSHAIAPEVQHLPPPWEPSHVRPRLPLGAAIVAVLIGISGMVFILAGGLFLANIYTAGVVPNDLLIVSSVSSIGAALLVVLGAVLLALATSLWRQESWALWTTVVVVFGGLAFLFFTDSITYLFVVLLVVFVYLLAVRRHFY